MQKPKAGAWRDAKPLSFFILPDFCPGFSCVGFLLAQSKNRLQPSFRKATSGRLLHETAFSYSLAQQGPGQHSRPCEQQSGSQHGEPGVQHAAPGWQQACDPDLEKRPAQAVPATDSSVASAAPMKYLRCMGNSRGIVWLRILDAKDDWGSVQDAVVAFRVDLAQPDAMEQVDSMWPDNVPQRLIKSRCRPCQVELNSWLEMMIVQVPSIYLDGRCRGYFNARAFVAMFGRRDRNVRIGLIVF